MTRAQRSARRGHRKGPEPFRRTIGRFAEVFALLSRSEGADVPELARAIGSSERTALRWLATIRRTPALDVERCDRHDLRPRYRFVLPLRGRR